ncbi:hypothetical protein [Dermabacter hominis]|uniref:hypothetical protein n=1 Tax=Dermabacter hominis TaxID=36740 RepID=UPI002431B680|nr:hypothetical protein [Dermabacter hominis]
MNWVNGLYFTGVALVSVSALGMMLVLGSFINADIEGKPINWKRTYPTIAVLTVSLLAGAFMAGATA